MIRPEQAMTFDRLVYIDRLKGAGVDEAVARAHAEALRDALAEGVATKADVQDLGVALRAEMRDLSVALRGEMRDVGTALRAEMQDLAASVDRKIDTLDRRGDSLDHKIDLVARDLVIKGASGLVVIAGLMIGLKLLG